MCKKQVVACAQWILELGSGKKEADLGSHWFARWEKRHPELHEIITKPISNTRKEAAEDYNIKEWFELLEACMKEYDIGEGEIWNFDETGFQVGMLKGTKVMVPHEIKQAYIQLPEN